MDELPPIPAGPSILAQQQPSPIHRDAMAALPLYMRVGKLSAEVARVFRLV